MHFEHCFIEHLSHVIHYYQRVSTQPFKDIALEDTYRARLFRSGLKPRPVSNSPSSRIQFSIGATESMEAELAFEERLLQKETAILWAA